jgi:uncharacterized protein (DUF1697 family)
MVTYLAFLRGINVSGQKQIKMNDLAALFIGLGAEDVRTYIQSGNVVFRYPDSDLPALIRLISGKIFEKYGFEVPVLIRTASELREMLARNSFTDEIITDANQPYVTFLSEEPAIENLEKLNSEHYEPDRFRVLGRAIYLYCPGGYGQTKLSNAFLEKKLKVTATTRNWKTIQALVNLADQAAGRVKN